MLTRGMKFLLPGTVFWCTILQAAPIVTSYSEDPSRFQLIVDSGPILTTQTFVLNFGTLWDVELSINEQADPTGDILDIGYTMQHATATHPGIPPLGPVFSGSITADARASRGQPGFLTFVSDDTTLGHGPGRNDFVRIRLQASSPSRHSDEFESWRLDFSGGDVPEPSSLLLCLGGGILLALGRRVFPPYLNR